MHACAYFIAWNEIHNLTIHGQLTHGDINKCSISTNAIRCCGSMYTRDQEVDKNKVITWEWLPLLFMARAELYILLLELASIFKINMKKNLAGQLGCAMSPPPPTLKCLSKPLHERRVINGGRVPRTSHRVAVLVWWLHITVTINLCFVQSEWTEPLNNRSNII